MTDITLRSVKGTSLSHNEMDNNFVASKSGRKNLVINGDFRIWQRGTSFTNATSSYAYAADRWRFFGQATTGSATVSRQAFTVGQTDVPGEPTYYLRWNQTVAATGTVALTQPIENVRTYAGSTVIINFYAKAAATRTIKVRLSQNFGSGGSTTVSGTETDIDLTTSWQQFTATITLASISGKTIGTSDYLDMVFLDSNSSTFTIDLANVQVEAGSVATDFEYRPLTEEVALCQRYYEKSYVTSIAPGTLVTAGSKRYQACAAISTGTPTTESFVVEKREIPTVTIYSPNSGSSGKAYNTTSAGDFTAFASLTGTNGFGLSASSAGISDQDLLSYHYTADAEL